MRLELDGEGLVCKQGEAEHPVHHNGGEGRGSVIRDALKQLRERERFRPFSEECEEVAGAWAAVDRLCERMQEAATGG